MIHNNDLIIHRFLQHRTRESHFCYMINNPPSALCPHDPVSKICAIVQPSMTQCKGRKSSLFSSYHPAPPQQIHVWLPLESSYGRQIDRSIALLLTKQLGETSHISVKQTYPSHDQRHRCFNKETVSISSYVDIDALFFKLSEAVSASMLLTWLLCTLMPDSGS